MGMSNKDSLEMLLNNLDKGNIQHNSSAERILGLSRDQLLGRSSTDPKWKAIRQDGSPFPGEEHPAMVTLRTGEPQHGIIMGVHKPEGSLSWLSINSQPVMGSDTQNTVAVVATFVDVTERLSREEELTRVSETDNLTQISNRLKFSSILTEEMEKSHRYGYALSLLMFDIDHFKRVNDTYGHDVGDIVLVETVHEVKQLIRESDLLARWGGEEFIILLPHTDLSEAADLGERIRAAIEKKHYRDIGHITCSFGAVAKRDSETEDDFTKRVDEALYAAKEAGRNRVIASDTSS